MNVVFCNRPDWESNPGGDTVQMLQTKEALEQRGVRVVIAKHPNSLQNADLVHIFNTQRAEELVLWAQQAKRARLPVVLSTIHWDLSHYIYVANLYKLGLDCSRWDVSSFKPCFDLLASVIARFADKPDYYGFSHRRAVRSLFDHADLLLPNSEEEAAFFFQNYGLSKKPYRVVPNAIEASLFQPSKVLKTLDVVCVGRVEPTKNQQGLLRAVSGHGWKTVLIGRDGENSRYTAALHQLALAEQVEVLGSLPQAEVARHMQRARVHVLPSFRESPGLVTLEALAMGCNVVVSDSRFCPVNTYFKDLLGQRVFVCDPYRSSSIASAIEQAFESVSRIESSDYLPPQWSEVGDATLRAYKELL